MIDSEHDTKEGEGENRQITQMCGGNTRANNILLRW